MNIQTIAFIIIFLIFFLAMFFVIILFGHIVENDIEHKPEKLRRKKEKQTKEEIYVPTMKELNRRKAKW